jgi:hypothetical protein
MRAEKHRAGDKQGAGRVHRLSLAVCALVHRNSVIQMPRHDKVDNSLSRRRGS